MDRDFANWFCGFVDGEGCFGMYPQPTHFHTDFTIRLRRDDYPILQECQQAFGDIGKLAVQTDDYVAQWKVSNAQEQSTLVNFFDQYKLRAKKAADFLLWRQAVIERCKPSHLRDKKKLQALCEQMHYTKRMDGGQLALDFDYPDPQLHMDI